MIDTFISALWQLLGNPLYIGALVGGCVLGLFFGVLPGLGGTICLALLLPFTWGMDPFVVMYLFSGVIGAVMVGGSVTSILVNIPGTGGNLATIFDGYPMSQKGEAGKAIGIAAISSVLGGLFGIGWLIILLPVVVFIIMSFAAPEICALILVGITTIVAASRVNLIKGLSMGGIGMLISFIGYSDTTGVTRYTGGLLFLWDGIGLIPFILGVFAISEVILLVRHGETIAKIKPGMLLRRWANAKDGFKTILQHKLCFLRSSAIGTLVGLVPGIGGAVATLLAYTAEMQSSKHPERFGQGLPEGVLAPEAANNAKDGGALLTTVAFGLPGSAEMVMLLAAFIMHGFAPGPTLLNEHLELVVALIIGLTLSNLLSTLIVILASKELSKAAYIQPYYIAPIVTVLCVVGVFAVRGEILDIPLLLLIGIFSYELRRAGFPTLPLIMGFILGSLFEHSLLQSLMISYGKYSIFFMRPIALGFLILAAVMLILPWLRRKDPGGKIKASLKRKGFPFLSLGLLLMVLVMVIIGFQYQGKTRMLPLFVGVPTLLMLTVLVLGETTFPGLISRFEIDLLGTQKAEKDKPSREGVEAQVRWTGNKAVLFIFGWLVSFLIMITVLGYDIAILISVFVFVRLYGKQGWIKSALVGLGVWAFTFIVFRFLMRLDMFQGLIFG